jgi:hypothetical protein
MFKIGQSAEWHQVVSNYGHISVHRVKIVKIGPKRITVEVPFRTGGVRKVAVMRERLQVI